jgi:hypothetical protein
MRAARRPAGTELTSPAVRGRVEEIGVEYVAPKMLLRELKGRLRDESPSISFGHCLKDRRLVEAWQIDYNTVRSIRASMALRAIGVRKPALLGGLNRSPTELETGGKSGNTSKAIAQLKLNNIIHDSILTF